MLLPQPLVRTGGPSTLLVSLNQQPEQQRSVLHLLHYIPERRGLEFDTIEDVIPVFKIPVSVRADRAITSVSLVPGSTPIPFKVNSGRVDFIVPEVNGHQMVEMK